MRNSPSLWGGGVEWGPAATPGANGYWQASADPTTTDYGGRPVLSVAFAGVRQTGGVDGSFSLGRDGWLSTLAPNTASFTLHGSTSALLGDSVVVSTEVDDSMAGTHPPSLWLGRVDTVSTTTDTSGNTTSTVTATDPIGVLGRAEAPSSVGSGTLKEVAETLSAGAGVPLVVETSDTLPSLLADGTVTESVLSYINRAELSSNALLFLLGNGRLRAVIRQASAESEVEVVPLSGDDAPRTWTTTLDLDQVVNQWAFESELAGGWSQVGDGEGQMTYGVRRFDVHGMLGDNTTVWNDVMTSDALAVPRLVLSRAEFPVGDLGRAALWLGPLDWIDLDSTTWQVMSVQHMVSLNDWTVTITGDQTQNFILGDPDPDPEEPDSPTGTTTITQTYTATKCSTVFRSSGGAQYGNGNGSRLVAGYYQGGRARALIQYPIDWGDFPGFIRVKKAKARLRSGTQAWVAFGSSPKSYFQRITKSWSEGSYDASPPSQYGSNAVVWPGPDRTSSGQVTRSFGTATSNWTETDITAIAQGWRDNGNNGMCIRSVNEDSSKNTIEFFSDDTGSAPELILTCEVTV